MPLDWRRRSAQVVKMAPRVIWPSMPMFHSPTVKVRSSPAVTRSSGTQETRTLEISSQEPTAPSTMFAYAWNGGALVATSTTVVRARATTTAASWRRALRAAGFTHAPPPRQIAPSPCLRSARRAPPRTETPPASDGETRPAKKTTTRSLYCRISSRSAEMNTMAVPCAQRSLSFAQMYMVDSMSSPRVGCSSRIRERGVRRSARSILCWFPPESDSTVLVGVPLML